MTANICWFCGETIELNDVRAVRITLENLMRATDAIQTIASHAECARVRLTGATMMFDPEVLFD
jgi:hypothetical protein